MSHTESCESLAVMVQNPDGTWVFDRIGDRILDYGYGGSVLWRIENCSQPCKAVKVRKTVEVIEEVDAATLKEMKDE
jgi:hypothetical protein